MNSKKKDNDKKKVKKSENKKNAPREQAAEPEYPHKDQIEQFRPTPTRRHVSVSVPTGNFMVSLGYDPKELRQFFKSLFSGFLQSITDNGRHTFVGPAGRLETEVVGARLPKKTKGVNKKAFAYAKLAMREFDQKVAGALFSYSDQLILQCVIAVLYSMIEVGAIELERRAFLKVWRTYLSSYEAEAKAQWSHLRPGKEKKWTEQRLLKLFLFNERQKKIARRLKEIREGKKNWKKSIRDKYGDKYDFIFDQLAVETVKDLSLMLTGVHFGLLDMDSQAGIPGLKRRLAEGGALMEERERESKRKEVTEEDILHSGFTNDLEEYEREEGS